MLQPVGVDNDVVSFAGFVVDEVSSGFGLCVKIAASKFKKRLLVILKNVDLWLEAMFNFSFFPVLILNLFVSCISTKLFFQ